MRGHVRRDSTDIKGTFFKILVIALIHRISNMSYRNSNTDDESNNEIPNMEDIELGDNDHIAVDEPVDIAFPTSSLSTDDQPVHGNYQAVSDVPAIASGSSGSQPMNYDHGECAICMGPQTDRSRLLCGHVFCFQCLVNWCRVKLQCPTCRQPFTYFVHNRTGSSHDEVYTPTPPLPPPPATRLAIAIRVLPVSGNDENGWIPLNDEEFRQLLLALFQPNITEPRADDQPNPATN